MYAIGIKKIINIRVQSWFSLHMSNYHFSVINGQGSHLLILFSLGVSPSNKKKKNTKNPLQFIRTAWRVQMHKNQHRNSRKCTDMTLISKVFIQPPTPSQSNNIITYAHKSRRRERDKHDKVTFFSSPHTPPSRLLSLWVFSGCTSSRLFYDISTFSIIPRGYSGS